MARADYAVSAFFSAPFYTDWRLQQGLSASTETNRCDEPDLFGFGHYWHVQTCVYHGAQACAVDEALQHEPHKGAAKTAAAPGVLFRLISE